jgi:tRNA nucleotidyltransferase (CCA-adding enzyme)
MELHHIWQVGGSVRDEVMNRLHNPANPHHSKDIDFAVQATFGEMKEWMQAHGFKIWLEKPEFFTLRAGIPPGNDLRRFAKDADFVVCRRDGIYTDNRHPESVEPGTIEEDLARRDFTMNAMAINVATRELLDPHNGTRDMRINLIRCVGDPHERIVVEDALRGLRAIRFAITKGMDIEGNILAVMNTPQFAEALRKISNERKREEIMRATRVDTVETLMTLVHDFNENTLRAIFDGLLWLKPSLED